MIHYKVTKKDIGELVSEYPHSPEDQEQSQVDFLEDMLSQGLDLVSRDGMSSGWFYTFRIVAK